MLDLDEIKREKMKETLLPNLNSLLSHEFNTILTSIYSGSEYAIMRYEDLFEKNRDILPADLLEILLIVREGSTKLKDFFKILTSEDD